MATRAHSSPEQVAGHGVLARLPRGRHRVPPEMVVDSQRRRLLAAAAQAVAIHGYSGLTVKLVIESAGVSRTTFYQFFDDKRDCVLAAHRDLFERLLATILRTCAEQAEWPRKARAALGSCVRLLAAEPGSVQLLTMSGAGVDPLIARQVEDSNARLAAFLRDGRRHTRFDPSLPALTEEAIIGALLALGSARAGGGGAADLTLLEPELAQILLTPYVGSARAATLAAEKA